MTGHRLWPLSWPSVLPACGLAWKGNLLPDYATCGTNNPRLSSPNPVGPHHTVRGARSAFWICRKSHAAVGTEVFRKRRHFCCHRAAAQLLKTASRAICSEKATRTPVSDPSCRVASQEIWQSACWVESRVGLPAAGWPMGRGQIRLGHALPARLQ